MTLYQHYKGGKYELLCHAIDTKTGKTLVIYQSLEDERIYARDWEEFHGPVDDGGPRFWLIDPK